MRAQAESAQEELSGQLRRALGRLQGSDEQLLVAQQRLAFVAAEKKDLSQHCSELEQRLATMQQMNPSGYQRTISELRAALEERSKKAAETEEALKRQLLSAMQLAEGSAPAEGSSPADRRQVNAAAGYQRTISELRESLEERSRSAAGYETRVSELSSALEKQSNAAAGYQSTIHELRNALEERSKKAAKTKEVIRALQQDKTKAER